MLDIGVSKLIIIGGIALVVIGPERLPAVARTAGTLLARARRYVADVKGEVQRSMELEELRKVKDSMQDAARAVEQSVQSSLSGVNSTLAAPFAELQGDVTQSPGAQSSTVDASGSDGYGFEGTETAVAMPQYRHPGKNWRLKRGALPRWYKQRMGLRSYAQSGAARVARHRPGGGLGS